MKRIFLFLLTNLAVIVVASLVMNILSAYFGVNYLDALGGYGPLAIMCLVWGMAGSFISLAMSRWMAKKAMGVQVINPQAGGEYGWLVQSIHKMAKEVGITTMPEVGVFDSPEMNAFATGATKNSALVAVSTGLLQKMKREEIEGVLGHEVAHIANGDMVTMTLLQGIMNAFVMFAARVIAGIVTRSDDNRNGGGMVYFLVVIALDILLGMLAMIVVAWFSRHREFRADLGGAKLQSKQKMISALKALKNNVGVKKAEPAAAQMNAFMISGNALKALWSTHPALDDRIKALQNTPNLL